MHVEKILESLRHDLQLLLVVQSAGNMATSVQDVELVEPFEHISF